MKKHYYPRIVAVLLGISFSSVATAQIKNASPVAQQPSGHQLYKQSKLYDSQSGPTEGEPERVPDNATDRIHYLKDRIVNPLTNELPSNIINLELAYINKVAPLPSANAAGKGVNRWYNRGPFNVGGRTRALAIDLLDENNILAGGVSGGLWRSRNQGRTWRQVTREFQTPSITCIVQDPRPGHQFTWYYGTGEEIGNSASARGAFYTGSGIFKSQDGGRTWEELRSTFDNDLTEISPFDIINSIVVDPTNGDVYVATWNGIHKSTDGGNTFKEVLVGGRDNRTEIAVTSKGIFYASIDSNVDDTPTTTAPRTGIFTSTDGETWEVITPVNYPITYGRTVFGINPSDENEVYVFARDFDGQENDGIEAYLWRYNADKEEKWVDLSENLPTTIGGPVGNLNLQTGYNMYVKVHPTNDQLVFIAGTNIYRSFDGFTTKAGQESWIGGYSPINNVSIYPDQHPDNHELLFFPSNPNKVLSGSDGGVAITEDITTTLSAQEPVDWISLNNGYSTTQPYHVSYDPQANNELVIAGFQDNGTWSSSDLDEEFPWMEEFGGDGAFSAVADGGLSRYVSSQSGRVFRINYNENGERVSFARVQPAGAAGFSFINPFILDANEDNIMYMPIGRTIWRNNDLDGIPLGSNALATVNWVNLTQTEVPSIIEFGRERNAISALDISTYPEANKLYYGTGRGNIYRLDNANLDGGTPVDISTGKGLPEDAFVNRITVDPSNSDRVMIAFSNYEVPSVFITEDAGETWTDVSGTLEENRDGSGSGPSVRDVAFIGNGNGYLVGASTGLFFADRLQGQNTVWRRDNRRIGNAVVSTVKSRKDGFTVAGTHGNGVFNHFYRVDPRPEPTLSVAYLLEDRRVPIGMGTFEIDATDLFVSSTNAPITIEFENTNPNFATVDYEDEKLSISFTDPEAIGTTAIRLIATSGEEQVAAGLSISTFLPPIYAQNGPVAQSAPSQFFTDFNALVQVADDFDVPDGDKWIIDKVIAPGSAGGSIVLDQAQIVVFSDNTGKPGEIVYNSEIFKPTSDSDDSVLDLSLPTPIELNPGKYWITVYVHSPFAPGNNQWFWQTQNRAVGLETQFKDEGDLFGAGALDWTPVSTVFGRNPADQIFQLFGVIQENGTEGIGTEINEESIVLADLETKNVVTVAPNPSNDSFNFEFGLKDETAKITIYNITGQQVFSKKIGAATSFTWDASSLPAGIYISDVSGTYLKQVQRLVKK